MNFNEELKQRVEQINALLAAKLPAEVGMQQRVAEAMNYSVKAGGKDCARCFFWRCTDCLAERMKKLQNRLWRRWNVFIRIHWCMMIYRQWTMTITAAAN